MIVIVWMRKPRLRGGSHFTLHITTKLAKEEAGCWTRVVSHQNCILNHGSEPHLPTEFILKFQRTVYIYTCLKDNITYLLLCFFVSFCLFHLVGICQWAFFILLLWVNKFCVLSASCFTVSPFFAVFSPQREHPYYKGLYIARKINVYVSVYLSPY